MSFPKPAGVNKDDKEIITTTSLSSAALLQLYNEAHDLVEEKAVLTLTKEVKNWAEAEAKKAGWLSMAFVGSQFIMTDEAAKQPASATTGKHSSSTPMPKDRMDIDVRGRTHDATRR